MSSASEVRVKANAVSRGVALGKAVCLFGKRRQFFRSVISDKQIPKEQRRFRAAIRLAVRQLKRLEKGTDSSSGIVEFQRMVLQDPALLKDVESRIADERVNAEWAVKSATDKYIAKLKSIPDERLRERYHDIEDVTDRLLAALGGGRNKLPSLTKGAVIVSRDLNPSTFVEIANSQPAAIVTEHGGWTSHTFILARELGIPAVAGVTRALQRIRNGDVVSVDGFSGEVIIRPVSGLESRAAHEHYTQPTGQEGRAIVTVDGREITIRANADIAGGYERARAFGARGIGLFRSEYAFNRFRGVPNEEEQCSAYYQIAQLAGDDGVKIRTFDFGADDAPAQNNSNSKNPALGLRAIRYGLEHEEQLRTQLRALLRASFGQTIDIVLPMISDLAEIKKVRSLLDEERTDLKDSGIHFGSPRLGVMVEVPSAVLMIDEIIKEVDLVCLGTNDLVQYLLAVDRDNESVAGWFRTLNPAVVRAVKAVIDSAQRHGSPCVVCGEMAGSPYYVPALIGLGATELSMNPNSVGKIKSLISGIKFSDAVKLAKLVAESSTADDAESVNREFIVKNWAHLYDPSPAEATKGSGSV